MPGARGRQFIACITVGCVLGAATVATVAPGAGAHATAKPAIVTNDCEEINVNDDGWDFQNNGAYGNEGYIYINSSGVIDNLHDAIFRNFFVTGDEENNVEGGWTADNGGHSGTTVYSEWKIDGVQFDPVYYTGYSLSTGTNKVFRVVNVGGVGIFRFYVDNQSDPYSYSPEMNFQNGFIQTNTERYNSCDSMYEDYSKPHVIEKKKSPRVASNASR